MTKTDPRAQPVLRFPEFVALMAGLMAVTALSVDVMLPALDQIRDQLDVVGANRQQLVVASYMLGFALGQVVYGPLSDRFGRRPVLFVGLGIYALAALACVWAGSLDALLAARFVQGVGGASPRVVAVAAVRDSYEGRRMAEVMSFAMMVFIIVPVLAPGVGEIILFAGGWRLIFGFLAVIGFAMLGWTMLRLPETRAVADRAPLSAAWLKGALHQTVTSRLTLGYTLATGMIFGALLTYISTAQQIYTEIYGLGALFPVVFGIVALGMAAAALVNSRMVRRVGMRRMSHWALLGFVAAGIGLGLLGLRAEAPPLVVFVGLLGAALFCFGLIMPNFNAIAMEPMGRIAGTASSFIGAVTTAMAALLGGWMGQLYDGTVAPLTLSFALFGLIALGIVLVTERGRLFRAGG